MKTTTTLLLILLTTVNTFAITNEEAVASFEIHPDFTIELVASEPQVFDPVDLKFDAQGRMFVVEMPGYPFPSANGSVVLLEDSDSDGHYETRKVFATGFEVATSLLPYEGGFLVASPPDILFLKDTDGDDVADVCEVVLTGFEADNQQHNINGLTLGLDNWIYIANGGNSGSPHWPDTPDEKVGMRYDDMRFKWSSLGRTERQLERYARSSGGFGITHDNVGRWFSTHNTQHIQQIVFPGRYLEDIPAPREGSLAQISDHEENGLARIYPIGKQETRVNHPEQSGFFSGGCGITFYNGGAFDIPGFDNAVFVCDVVLNLVHVDFLSDQGGTTLVASRDTTRPKQDFLASTDRAFRPVNMSVGPDGALYLLDMHRDVIEHPEWIPDEMEEKLDVNKGKDQGRIYRITQKDKERTSIDSRLDECSNEILVEFLGSGNGWKRKMAQQLLIERNAIETVSALEEMIAKEFTTPAPAIHAMWTLEAFGKLSLDSLRWMVTRGDERAEQALMIAQNLPDLSPPDNKWRSPIVTASMNAKDSTRRVRMLTALVAGSDNMVNNELFDYLETVARADAEDAWSRLALTSAVGYGAGVLSAKLFHPAMYIEHTSKAALLKTLAESAGASRYVTELIWVLMFLSNDTHNEQLQLASLNGFLSGLNSGSIDTEAIKKDESIRSHVSNLMNSPNLRKRRGGWEIARLFGMEADTTQQDQIAASKALAIDSSVALDDRLAHLSITEFDTPENRTPLLFSLLNTKQPAEIQQAAIAQLSGISGQSVAEKLVERWDTLGPAVRTRAGDILLYKRENHEILMDAMEDGTLTLGEMNLHLERRRTLLYSRVLGIKERAEKLFTDAGVVTRKEALNRMRPALSLPGDPMKGQITFTEVCATCHTVGDAGSDLAPNLTEIFRKSGETLLHDIVDPNAATDAQYIAYNVETTDGEFFSGIVVRDDAFGVTLRNADGEKTIARETIAEMFSSGLSLMPEELDTDMDVQSMADLLAFLQEPK